MSTAADSADEAALTEAMAPLLAIDPAQRIATPPQRLPLPDGRECLVQWQADSDGGDWSLVLHARAVDVTDTATPLARLALHLRDAEPASAVFWENADQAFREWVPAHLPGIVRQIAGDQAAEFAAVRQRAGLAGNVVGKLSGLLPHVVVLGGLAAFAYMFGIVHIK